MKAPKSEVPPTPPIDMSSEPTPPMEGDMNMGDMPMEEPPMGNEEPVDGEPNDPKKSIQQLVGKLSQELRDYNNNQPNQDTDLNKYVAGMIIPQATSVMTDQDKNEVIDKIKSGNTDTSDDSEPMGDEPIVNEVINSLVDGRNTKREDKKIRNADVKKGNPFKANR